MLNWWEYLDRVDHVRMVCHYRFQQSRFDKDVVSIGWRRPQLNRWSNDITISDGSGSSIGHWVDQNRKFVVHRPSPQTRRRLKRIRLNRQGKA